VSYLNVTNAEKTDSVNATIDLRDDSGSPFNVNIIGMGAASNFQTGNMVPYHTSLYMTDGTGTLKSGWASVRGSARLSGSIISTRLGWGAWGWARARSPGVRAAGGTDAGDESVDRPR